MANQPPYQAPPPGWVPPDTAPAADLPIHARERLIEMRKRRFFTSDLSVNEFLLVKEVGFDPLGLVMGSSIYQIKPRIPPLAPNQTGCELDGMTQALYHSRELAMNRMEEEADALGADGIVGVRLTVNLHAWGSDIAEFIAIGTAVKHRGGGNFRNAHNKPFQSDLTGQDFWTLLRAGYRPVGFVMGNCVYYVRPEALQSYRTGNTELTEYIHAFYDARELAIERLQAEAEDLHAEGIVGVTVEEKEHSWGRTASGIRVKGAGGNLAMYTGELIEFFVVGTAVVPMASNEPIPVPYLVIPANK
jgi:uncharacterized protein YbjQ (UPF0145 family)